MTPLVRWMIAGALLLGAAWPAGAQDADAWKGQLSAADELIARGRAAEARTHLEALLRDAPPHHASEVHLRLASILAADRDWSRAISHGEAAIQAWPDNGWIYLPVARILVAAGRPEAARRLCEEATRRDPAVRMAAQDLVYQIQSGTLAAEAPAPGPAAPLWPWAAGALAALLVGALAWPRRPAAPSAGSPEAGSEPSMVAGRVRAEPTGPMAQHQTGPVSYGPVGTAVRKPGEMIGAYRVKRVVGSSLHSILYHAEDTRDGRAVALKQVGSGGEASEAVLARFQKEVQSLMAISSHLDGVVKVLDYLAPSMLVTEWVDGQNLEEAEQLAVDEILRIGMALCEVLSFCHTQGIVHRDIKPSNVMRTREGRVKLLDFGIAKNAALGTSNLTLDANVPIGTFTYMSPEQFSAPNQARPAADLYSLGLTLYRLITDRMPTEPWLGPRTFGLIPSEQFRPIDDQSPAVRKFVEARGVAPDPAWLADLQGLVRSCFEENPANRPGSAVGLRWELEALLGRLEAMRASAG